MVKTSKQPTRQLLLDAGMDLVRANGLRGLTVRGLAARAGVNPGGFVYHFGSRDAFLAELIETWYAPLFAQLTVQLDRGHSPLARLRAMLLQLLDFLRENRGFVVHLLQDVAAGEPAAIAFVQSVQSRHPQLLLQLVREAQEAGEIVRADPLQQLLFIMAPLTGPLVLEQMLCGRPGQPEQWRALAARLALDPAAIEQRLDWALLGLQSPKPNG